jgi:acetylornithine/N-succinyldiaminopimelate aminotransferase
MNKLSTQAIVAATARRDVAAPSAASAMPVTREMFDELMVRCYAPASFIPCAARARASGTRTGRMYIDFAAGVAVTSLGHCHPR